MTTFLVGYFLGVASAVAFYILRGALAARASSAIAKVETKIADSEAVNHRLQSFIEAHPWAAPIVAVLAWLVNAGVWLFEHPDHISKWFAAASAILGFGVLWYTFRIKRREFRRGATHAPFANREDDDDFDPQDPSGLR